MLVQDNQKPFENPPAGQYIGLLADVVDLGLVKTGYKPDGQLQARLIWLLFGVNAQGQLIAYADKENRQFRVMRQVNQSMNPKSKLFETVSDVLNGEQVPVPFETENLIGRVNLLFVKIEKQVNGTKEFANVKAILPLPANTPIPTIPAGFMRNKDKQQQQNKAAAPVQTVGVAQVAAATLPPTAQAQQATAIATGPVPAVAIPAQTAQASPVVVIQAAAPAIDLNAKPLTPAVQQL